jgi:hypothetical protein
MIRYTRIGSTRREADEAHAENGLSEPDHNAFDATFSHPKLLLALDLRPQALHSMKTSVSHWISTCMAVR